MMHFAADGMSPIAWIFVAAVAGSALVVIAYRLRRRR